MQNLLNKIKQKKELRDLDDDFVKKEIKLFFKSNPKKLKVLEKPKSAKYKEIVKEIRAKLRRSFGLFRDDKKKRLKLLKQDDFVIKEILKTHPSTKERLAFYQDLYKKIFAITGVPKSILDLGSGINPYSYQYMQTEASYLAYDIDKEEVEHLNQYFKKYNINGRALVKDISQLSRLPKVDLTLLFKVTDVLDKGKGHKTTEALLKKIKSKFIVVSFPTLTMSGKKMNFPRRKWIELLCHRLGYTFKSLEFPGEIFYVIKK
tara:strand:- start:11153 stop:11935 length:783 start_codon:yes stop_codon:yes gene_type:complete